MRLLMDSGSLRRLELLELLNGSDEWWTVEEIALRLNCSVRSIKADIYFYNTFSSNSIKLITSNHRGVKMILPAYFQMGSIYQEILTDNVNYQILESLYQEKLESIEDYAEDLFTSTSSIVRSIKQINLFLEEYNLSIQKKPMKIIGSEIQIRYFFGIFFWEKYGTKMVGTQQVEFNEARRIIKELEKKTDITLSHIVENKLAICLLICRERINKGYILQKYTAPIKASEAVLKTIEDLMKDFPMAIPKIEIEFMSFYFTNEYLNLEVQLDQLPQELLAIFERIDQFLVDFSEKYSFVLPNKEVVQQNIFHHIVYNREFQGRNFFLVNHTKNTLLNIDKMYHPFINLVFEEIEASPDNRWISESKQEFFELLYLLIVSWEGLTSQILHLQEKTNVLIISQFGKAHEFFLADILESYFPNELDCFSETDNHFKDSEMEVVVTDTQVEAIQKNPLNEIPVIGIDYAPNERNWKTLRSVLAEIKKSKEEGGN